MREDFGRTIGGRLIWVCLQKSAANKMVLHEMILPEASIWPRLKTG